MKNILEQNWQWQELRNKAYETYKTYRKAHDEYDDAMQSWRDIPAPAHHAHQQSLEMYKRIHNTKHKMKEAHGLMAEAYWAYEDHSRKMRKDI